jgi:hypothetical protein
MGRPYLDDTA